MSSEVNNVGTLNMNELDILVCINAIKNEILKNIGAVQLKTDIQNIKKYMRLHIIFTIIIIIIMIASLLYYVFYDTFKFDWQDLNSIKI